MMHSAHKAANYNEAQVLHDECEECESRGENAFIALTHMDGATFQRAWKRAAQLQVEGLPGAAHNEILTLHALIGVQLQLERLGVPIGTLPIQPSERELTTNDVELLHVAAASSELWRMLTMSDGRRFMALELMKQLPAHVADAIKQAFTA